MSAEHKLVQTCFSTTVYIRSRNYVIRRPELETEKEKWCSSMSCRFSVSGVKCTTSYQGSVQPFEGLCGENSP